MGGGCPVDPSGNWPEEAVCDVPGSGEAPDCCDVPESGEVPDCCEGAAPFPVSGFGGTELNIPDRTP